MHEDDARASFRGSPLLIVKAQALCVDNTHNLGILPLAGDRGHMA